MKRETQGAFVSFALLILGFFLSVLAGKPQAGMFAREEMFWVLIAATLVVFLVTFFYYVIYEEKLSVPKQAYRHEFKV